MNEEILHDELSAVEKIKEIGAVNIWCEFGSQKWACEIVLYGEVFIAPTLEEAVDAAYGYYMDLEVYDEEADD